MALRGLAQCWGGKEYRDLLKPAWWYNWGVSSEDLNDPTYVPMLRSGFPNLNLPVSYSDYLLIFNEPNNKEPFGCNMPDYMVGICRYAILTSVYPKAKFIVGGVSAWKWGWLVNFHKMARRCQLRLPTGYSIHGYANDYGTTPHMIGWWKAAHDQIKAITSGLEFWITETNDMHGNPVVLTAILSSIDLFADRVAVYTARQESGAGYAINSKVEMIDDNGLTALGRVFTGK